MRLNLMNSKTLGLTENNQTQNEKISKQKKDWKIRNQKTSLSCFNDKRFVLDYGIHALAFFHKDSKTHLNV